MNKVCIIGKTGQLGGALADAASRRNLACLMPGRDTVEITRTERVRAFLDAEQPDVLMNTAAIPSPVACEQDVFAAYRVHAAAVYTLAALCRERRIRFVTISTDYVFDGAKGTAYTEDDLPNPLQAYGASKYAGEQAARSAYPEGSLVIRTSALYGGAGSPTKGNFVLAMRDTMLRGNAPEVVSDLVTSPTYAGHLADAILDLLAANAPAGVYHLAGEGQASWYDFACAIGRTFNLAAVPTPVLFAPNAGEIQRPRFTALENVNARALGIHLPPWQEGLEAYNAFLATARV